MRVLQLSKFYPPVDGGIETVCFELVEGLVARGHAVDVLCAHTSRPGVNEMTAHGVRITRAASWGKWLSTSMAPALVGELRRRHRHYDLIHVHMPDPLAALALRVAAPAARIVVHWHSDVVRQRLARHAYHPLERWLLDRADAVIATSRAYAESSPALRRVAHKVAVVPIGIGEPPSPPPAAEVEALRARFGGRRIVFSLGRMTYYKGFDVLVDAARALPDEVVVLVGGGGPLLEPLRARAAAAGVADRVRFLGRIDHELLEVCFAACELFCLASTMRAEAYGVAVLEAMARGRAVVSTDIPGSAIGWLNEHGTTGLKVPVRDAAALAGALRELLADDARRRAFGMAAHARWARHFSAGTMLDSTIALYRRVLGGADPRPAAIPDPR